MKMKSIIASLSLFLLISCTIFSQSKDLIVSGHISDKECKRIKDARAELTYNDGYQRTDITDENGFYFLSVTVGQNFEFYNSYSLKISKTGYKDFVTNFTIDDTEELNVLNYRQILIDVILEETQ